MNNPILNKILPPIFVLVIAIFAIKYALMFASLIAPFIIAFIIATMAFPIKKYLKKKNIHNLFSSLIAIFVILSILFIVIYYMITLVTDNSDYIISALKDILNRLITSINAISDKLSEKLPKVESSKMKLSQNDILNQIAKNSGTISKQIFSFAKDIPEIGFLGIITIISSFFIIIDYEKILKLINNIINRIPLLRDIIFNLKTSVFKGIKSWIKAQIIIMTFSTIICSIGFMLSGYSYWLLIGFLVAFADALPIIGSGAFLLPLALYNLISAKYYVTIILFISYILIIITRQIVEPRMVGNSIGIHPLLTLMAIYIGFSIKGIIGIIGAIVSLIIIVNIYHLKGEKNDILHKS